MALMQRTDPRAPYVTFSVAAAAADDAGVWNLVVTDERDRHGVDGARVLLDLAVDTRSRQSLRAALCDTALPEAAFFEVRPYSPSTFFDPFEAVLRAAPQLAALSEDSTPFRAQLDASKDSVVSFQSLGGDAHLVVPAPHVARRGPYTHLLAFMRNAPDEQCDALLRHVFTLYYDRIHDATMVGVDYPLWVSTAGTGVHYLHVRIDSQPKYYTTERFKTHHTVRDV